jgi:hypothetical protein
MGKFITNRLAKGLIDSGDAVCVGHTRPEGEFGRTYAILTRYDIQETAHTLDEDMTFETHPNA